MLGRAGGTTGGGKGPLLLSPVKPGTIIKFEGQSIVGKSNNNAIGQSAADESATKPAGTTPATTTDAEDESDENGFKITPDYIQESE